MTGDTLQDTNKQQNSLVCFFTRWSELKKKLIEQNIFVATYWPNVFEWCKPSDLEYNMADNIVCIPVDQRYGTKEMQRIVRVVLP